MTIKRTAFDVVALPTALLTIAKQHMRVDWPYDDDFIKSVVARAVARFEQVNGVSLNASTWEWKPASTDFSNDRARVPVTPVKTFTAAAGAAADNVSASFSIVTNSTYGVPILFMLGAYQDQLTVTLQTGFDTSAGEPLPPPVLDIVLRNAAHLYEHREILLPDQEFVSPDIRIDATWWVPRV